MTLSELSLFLACKQIGRIGSGRGRGRRDDRDTVTAFGGEVGAGQLRGVEEFIKGCLLGDRVQARWQLGRVLECYTDH